ncbi:hypothetical protein HK405_009912, partial [Cladochytrium tenue]
MSTWSAARVAEELYVCDELFNDDDDDDGINGCSGWSTAPIKPPSAGPTASAGWTAAAASGWSRGAPVSWAQSGNNDMEAQRQHPQSRPRAAVSCEDSGDEDTQAAAQAGGPLLFVGVSRQRGSHHCDNDGGSRNGSSTAPTAMAVSLSKATAASLSKALAAPLSNNLPNSRTALLSSASDKSPPPTPLLPSPPRSITPPGHDPGLGPRTFEWSAPAAATPDTGPTPTQQQQQFHLSSTVPDIAFSALPLVLSSRSPTPERSPASPVPSTGLQRSSSLLAYFARPPSPRAAILGQFSPAPTLTRSSTPSSHSTPSVPGVSWLAVMPPVKTPVGASRRFANATKTGSTKKSPASNMRPLSSFKGFIVDISASGCASKACDRDELALEPVDDTDSSSEDSLPTKMRPGAKKRAVVSDSDYSDDLSNCREAADDDDDDDDDDPFEEFQSPKQTPRTPAAKKVQVSIDSFYQSAESSTVKLHKTPVPAEPKKRGRKPSAGVSKTPKAKESLKAASKKAKKQDEDDDDDEGGEIASQLEPINKLEDMFADIVTQCPGIVEVAKKLQGRPLRVATMCSGTESPLLALNMIGRAIKEHSGYELRIEHVFSCEIEPFKQAYIERNFRPPILFRDVRELGGQKATTAYGALVNVPGDVDMLVAGTSCVDYSNLNNKKQDIDDKGESGETFRGMLKWVATHRPPIVILENVCSAPWDKVVEKFGTINYTAQYVRADTKFYYIPHTRTRVYLIAYDMGS